MKTWQHLVVAVADPFKQRHMAVKKAAAIAMRCHARITLFHAFSLPYPLPNPAPKSSDEALQAAMEYHRKAMEQLARPLRRSGLNVDCVVAWDFPAHEAIVRYVSKHKPDLLLAESQRHGKLARWLLTNTDWELIRACPCPLWFVKIPGLPVKLSVLAAVDPLHTHAKPEQLDERIVDTAVSLTTQLAGKLHLVHAYTAPLETTRRMLEPLRTSASARQQRLFQASITEQVEQLASRHNLPANLCMVKEGDAVTVIDALVRQKLIDVVVMGAVSRSASQRAFVGSTAEKVIDRLRCDLLIVKQNDFKSTVPKQNAAQRLHLRAS